MDPSIEKQYKKDTRYCLLCKKNETREECSWGPQMWDRYTTGGLDIGEAKKGLWDNIHAKRKRGERPAKPGEEGYPKTLNVEGMTMKDFKQQRSSQKQKEKRAAEKLSPTRRAGIHNPEKSPERAARRDAAMGETGHGGPLRAKKVRKARALGELGEGITYKEFMTEVSAWQRKEGKNKEGGLNEKGRKSYERENPGSDLKAPSKKVGNPRRASFCARMSGMKKKLTSKKTANDPNSRINKSLRSWNC